MKSDTRSIIGRFSTTRWLTISLFLVFILSYVLTTQIVITPPIGQSIAEWESLSVSEEYYDYAGFNEIAFFNATHGLLLGNRALLQTNNSGDSWSVSLAPDDGSLYGLSVVTPMDVWVSGILEAPDGYGQLFHTVDGGVTWQNVTTPPTIVPSVEFYNSTHGLVVDSHSMYRTVDGGNSWQAGVNWSSDYNPPRDFHLSASAYRVATFYGLYLSEDWGLTWKIEDSRATVGLSFISENEGWILFPFTVSHIVNGTLFEFPRVSRISKPSVSSYYDLEFIDSEHGWVVGIGPAVIYTPDGGDTWYEQITPDYHFKTVDFINETHGWTAGWRGAIARTRNGNSFGPRLLTGFLLIEPFTGSGDLIPYISLIAGTVSTTVYSLLIYKYKNRGKKSLKEQLEELRIA
ncbi:MAG: YCF48-related protein [Candidatus Thorarchaeota archaeon]